MTFIVISVFISDFLKENGIKIHKNTTCMLLFDVLLNEHDNEADAGLFFFFLHCVKLQSDCLCHLFAAFSLMGSELSFADLFRLVAFYCISR